MPTLVMSAALSITRAVRPPRAAFIDFPLGHTTGKPDEPELQREIVRDALRAFEELKVPGSVKFLRFRWGHDEWKRRERRSADRGTDERTERLAEPQYQTDDDRQLAEQRHSARSCGTCIPLDLSAELAQP